MKTTTEKIIENLDKIIYNSKLIRGYIEDCNYFMLNEFYENELIKKVLRTQNLIFKKLREENYELPDNFKQ
jgi:hypothetical protein